MIDKFNKFWLHYKGILHVAGWLVLALLGMGAWLNDVSAYGTDIKDLKTWKETVNERLARMDGNIEIIVKALGQKPLPKEHQ